jgi:SAM-dependent methyltransferase
VPPESRWSIRPALWDLSQKLFGADDEKNRLYFDALQVEDRSASILDFGCATGNASASFIGYNYTGIDIDPELIAHARAKFRSHPEMKFVAEDIEKFAPAQPFDYILFAGVAHHLDDELLPAILKRLRSMLSDTGHIYFIDPVITGTEGPLLRLLMALDQGKFHRSSAAYDALFKNLEFQVFERRLISLKGAIFPTPTCVVYKIK